MCEGEGGGSSILQVWSLISVKLSCFLFRACEACTGVTFLSFFVRSHSLSYNTQPGSISRQVWKSYSVRAMATEFLAGITGYAGTLYILYPVLSCIHEKIRVGTNKPCSNPWAAVSSLLYSSHQQGMCIACPAHNQLVFLSNTTQHNTTQHSTAQHKY